METKGLNVFCWNSFTDFGYADLQNDQGFAEIVGLSLDPVHRSSSA